ncbi:hypothetical protein L596_029693 [Steinernema carpocapsae]|uniref:Uncharacterized protein n=1 Tax=Steinernema carpocapsae TaxID=34508 RepID=A0A4U5LQJ3_STECR|nr:hypothetical protein L596_029693 [Steinernema carpocapsae]
MRSFILHARSCSSWKVGFQQASCPLYCWRVMIDSTQKVRNESFVANIEIGGREKMGRTSELSSILLR